MLKYKLLLFLLLRASFLFSQESLSIETMEEERKCPICYEDVIEKVPTCSRCNSIMFCLPCLDLLLKAPISYSRKCPLCRESLISDLKYLDLHNIYNAKLYMKRLLSIEQQKKFKKLYDLCKKNR